MQLDTSTLCRRDLVVICLTPSNRAAVLQLCVHDDNDKNKMILGSLLKTSYLNRLTNSLSQRLELVTTKHSQQYAKKKSLS